MIKRGKKAVKILLNEGIHAFAEKISWLIAERKRQRSYQRWIGECDTYSLSEIDEIRKRIGRFGLSPVISILMPVYDVDEIWLRKAIDSVLGQVYENWELCIADDNSPSPHVGRVLEEYAASDTRIKVTYRAENGHISAASNSALDLVTGDITVLMDHDDELAPTALYFVARELNAHPDADIFYSDEDKINAASVRFQPSFKPDWSPELMQSLNMVTHLIAYRTKLLRECGGFRLGYEGSQDYDLALRVSELTSPERIRHIPRVLYHWRAIAGSVALAGEEKPYAHDRARLAINDHFDRTGVKATSIPGYGHLHKVLYELPSPLPLISIILHGDPVDPNLGDLIRETSSGFPVEVLYPTNGIVAVRSENGIKPIRSDGDSKFALLKAGAAAAAGEIICFLDASTKALSHDWLRVLAGRVLVSEIGAVGAKVLSKNNRLKHTGYVLGMKGGVGNPYRNKRASILGNFFWTVAARNVSALSADFLMIRKKHFDEAGGFDSAVFPSRYADVDLCLRLRSDGLRNVWTPWAEAVQTPDIQSEDEAEIVRLQERWRTYFEHDPYFNQNLQLGSSEFELSFPPRCENF